MTQPGTIFERVGGEAAVMAAVGLFYEKIMADPTLAPFFATLDMDAQIQKQVAFMTMAFGGPSRYTGRDLRVAHAPLVRRGLDGSHFDAVARHLAAALAELSVEPGLIEEIIALVATTRGDVLGGEQLA